MMRLTAIYKPTRVESITRPEFFEVIDEDTKLGLRVHLGQANFIGWNQASNQYDHWGFEARTHRLTMELLSSFVDAYRKNRQKG